LLTFEKPQFNLGSHGTIRQTRHLLPPIRDCFIGDPSLRPPRPKFPRLGKNMPERCEAAADRFAPLPGFPKAKELSESCHVQHRQIKTSRDLFISADLSLSALPSILLCESVVGRFFRVVLRHEVKPRDPRDGACEIINAAGYFEHDNSVWS